MTFFSKLSFVKFSSGSETYKSAVDLSISVLHQSHDPNYLGKYKSHRGVPYLVGKRRTSSTGPVYFTFLSAKVK